MAKLFLEAADSITINDGMKVFGGTGMEVLKVASTVIGLTADGNIDRIEFTGASSGYNFQASGTDVLVYSGPTLVATIGVQDETDGTKLAFSDGSADLFLTGISAATLGGAALSAKTGGTTVVPTFDVPANNTPIVVAVSAAGTSDASTANKVYNIAGGTYTYAISGFGAGDVLDFPAGNLASVTNESYTDGLVDLTWASGGNVLTIHLTGIATANDLLLNSVADFSTVFGNGAII